MSMQYDIIIVGAGIIGTALYHTLTSTSHAKVLLLDSGEIAGETTGQSGGFCHAIGLTGLDAQWAKQSYSYYQEKQLLTNTGILYYAKQNYSGTPFYSADAGYIKPKQVCQLWSQSTNNHSQVKLKTSVHQLALNKSSVHGVITNDELIESRQVILATGYHTAQLLRKSSMYLETLQLKSFQYHRYADISSSKQTAAIIDELNDIYIIPQDDNQWIVGFLSRDKACHYDVTGIFRDYEESQALTRILNRHYSWLKQSHLVDIQNSLDAFTPNYMPYQQVKLPYSNLMLATGCSGGGVKIALGYAKHLISTLEL